MSHLPVIVSLGGINAAGRSSFQQGFKRMVFDALPEQAQIECLRDLHVLTSDPDQYQPVSDQELLEQHKDRLLNNTLVRKISEDLFDPDKVPCLRSAHFQAVSNNEFLLKRRHLPNQIPEAWTVTDIDAKTVKLNIDGIVEMMVPDIKASKVSSAGQLPSGFNPGALYQSRNHPRGLQMTVYGASDCIQSSGIQWDEICARVRPDQIAVYASSAMSQLDDNGSGGMMKAPHLGKRTSSKQCPLGFAEMPADFINAYIIGSTGNTGGAMGACASFLYNLQHGINDIKSGRRRVALVGTAEAPVLPEIIDGYAAMGALAEDAELLELDAHLGATKPDHTKACRPFADNRGFVIAESAQFVLLMDDELALEMGANILASVPDVFVHADGYKKSISAPGIGNYATMGKAAGLVKAMLGEEALQKRSYVHAHGTGTPQNRVTESHVLNEIAKAFNIASWPVAAVKCFLGHSIGSAGGDQISAAIAGWELGIIPGITTMNEPAADIHASHLSLSSQHRTMETPMDAALINAKGFGGNNSTAVLISPEQTLNMMECKYGAEAIQKWRQQNESVKNSSQAYNQAALKGDSRPIYRFGENVLKGEDLSINDRTISLPGQKLPIPLDVDNDFVDYCNK